MDYHSLDPGFEFPEKSFLISQKDADDYLDAVEDLSDIYDGAEGFVAPTALAAYALRGITETIPVPPGAIHGSQELEFLGMVQPEEVIKCSGKVAQNSVKMKRRFVVIDLCVNAADGTLKLRGKTTLILPLDSEES